MATPTLSPDKMEQKIVKKYCEIGNCEIASGPDWRSVPRIEERFENLATSLV